jgi:dTDP-4-dehydrorhamnose 3,5-epimerase
VDVRAGSSTFGAWVGAELSSENHRQLWVPPGFAHGFAVTSERALFVYKCTALYDPAAERCIRWNDPALAIAWPVMDAKLSPRDAAAPLLQDVNAADLPR